MSHFKDYAQFVNEMKSDRETVRDLARRLSLDKDVIKYLNTSRGKRKIGWRELLQDKLHGKNLDYINYITKNMVADYNPQITGYMKIDDGEDEDFDKKVEKERLDYDTAPIRDVVKDIEDRVEDIEDVLGIDPGDSDTVERAKEELGLNPDLEEEGDGNDDEKEEE